MSENYALSYSCIVDELTPLARDARRGDRAALADLIRATQGDVWRLCAHLVDPGAADDLAQETYLRAIPALRGFRGESSVRTWLLTIARRACAQEIKNRQRDRQASASLAADAVGMAAATAAAAATAGTSARVEITELLATLTPERRAAFVLTQVLGCTYEQTASICDCPVGTIRSRVARARADLDAVIQADKSGGDAGDVSAEGTL